MCCVRSDRLLNLFFLARLCFQFAEGRAVHLFIYKLQKFQCLYHENALIH